MRPVPRGMLRAWRRGKRVLTANLLLVNTGTCCAIYTVGDLLQQRIEGNTETNWSRTGRMAILGFMMGPASHYWYRFLDGRLPAVAASTVATKVLADQAVMAPLCCCGFYTGMCLLEGKGMSGAVGELRLKFWPTYVMDWTIWPAAQAINFFFVPPALRVSYVNVVTLVWTVYLSYMKHKDISKGNGRHQAKMTSDLCAASLRTELCTAQAHTDSLHPQAVATLDHQQ